MSIPELYFSLIPKIVENDCLISHQDMEVPVESDQIVNSESDQLVNVDNEQLVNDQMASLEKHQIISIENNEMTGVQNDQMFSVENGQLVSDENNQMVGFENYHMTGAESNQYVSAENDLLVSFENGQMVVVDNNHFLITENDGMGSFENDQKQYVSTENDQMVSFEDGQNQFVSTENDQMVSFENNQNQFVSADNDRMVSAENDHMVAIENNRFASTDNDQMVSSENDQMVTFENHNHSDMDTDEMVAIDENNELVIEDNNQVDPIENNQLEYSDNNTPIKRRKRKSLVWEHFTIEIVSPGIRRASCNKCKQSFAYSTGPKLAGTSHLKRHIIDGSCSKILRSNPNYKPPKRRGGTAASGLYPAFDPDRCRDNISQMIIMHDYPLHIVQHSGFITFVNNLQPRFNMVSFDDVEADCMTTYLQEKKALKSAFETIPGRICLTLDMLSSNLTTGYIFLTGSYIDMGWKLHRKVLNVVMEQYPESDSAFRDAVASCLSDWNLEGKLFSLTLNQTLSGYATDNLHGLFSIRNPKMLDGQLLITDCLARSLSSVARAAFSDAADIVKRVRESVRYVKSSVSREEKFLELKKELQVPSTKILVLDNESRWNTTYEMLIAALELREVFSCLEVSDPDYRDSLMTETWKQVDILCVFLKTVFEMAKDLSAPTRPIISSYFDKVWKIQLDLVRSFGNKDPFARNLVRAMIEKFHPYWKNCYLVLAVAVIMDPRFKMRLVEFSFLKIYGHNAAEYVKLVNDGIHELYLEYEVKGHGLNLHSSQGQNGLSEFDMFVMESTSQLTKSELDQYLDESVLPRVHDFDILGWWKINESKYPSLSKMARDILTIPVCTLEPESVFDTERRRMDSYRCSLRPETLEALVSAKDWLKSEPEEALKASAKMEFPI